MNASVFVRRAASRGARPSAPISPLEVLIESRAVGLCGTDALFFWAMQLQPRSTARHTLRYTQILVHEITAS